MPRGPGARRRPLRGARRGQGVRPKFARSSFIHPSLCLSASPPLPLSLFRGSAAISTYLGAPLSLATFRSVGFAGELRGATRGIRESSRCVAFSVPQGAVAFCTCSMLRRFREYSASCARCLPGASGFIKSSSPCWALSYLLRIWRWSMGWDVLVLADVLFWVLILALEAARPEVNGICGLNFPPSSPPPWRLYRCGEFESSAP